MSRRIQPSLPAPRVGFARAASAIPRRGGFLFKESSDIQLHEIPFDGSGGTNIAQLKSELNDQSMCVVVGYPNFFGVIEDLASIKALAAEPGTQVIAVTSEPLALALLKPPARSSVDIAVGEGQSLGVPMNLGGPAFGFFACQKKFVR
jgi:glycine dehydrogenase subunit 1